MRTDKLLLMRVLTLLNVFLCAGGANQPHIVFIMADDMGWHDVSFHGSDQVLTPNIDALAYQGVVLQQYYSEPICTPSRSALLTGKYPMRLGMQSAPLFNSEDRAIPLQERLLPAHLKGLGYSTHLVGKWHVGMSRPEFLPTSRGYDSHYGMRGGFVDYYTYNKIEEWPNGRVMFGQDFFQDLDLVKREEGYLTDILTEKAIEVIWSHNASKPLFLQLAHGAPHAGNAGAALQPPPQPTASNFHVAYSDRRLYADVVQGLDRSVGQVVRALADKGILDNTIIIFASDNGAPSVGMYANFGVNLPFRGIKQTPWEGGVRVPAIMYHSSLKPKVWNGLMHITDWLPTLVSAAGGKVTNSIDGVNQWDRIVNDGESRRGEVLITLDDLFNYAAYRNNDYKIVIGNLTGLKNGYYGENWMDLKASPPPYMDTVKASEVADVMKSIGRPLDESNALNMRNQSTVKQLDSFSDPVLCVPNPEKGCLFDVKNDPQERHDLWNKKIKLAKAYVARIKGFWSSRKPRAMLSLDDGAEPSKFHYNWLPWLEDEEKFKNETNFFQVDPEMNPFPKIGSAFLNITCLGLMTSNPIRLRNWNEMSSNQKISSIYSGMCIQYE